MKLKPCSTKGRKGPHPSKSVKMRGYDVYSFPSIVCLFYSFMVVKCFGIVSSVQAT